MARTKNINGGRKTLETFDASPLIGLNVVVHDAAYEELDSDGDPVVTVPRVDTLMASAAVARCLVPVKLRGHEMRAMRKIMGITAQEMAERLDAKTAPETISRWETESQPIGGYAEKVFRLLVCDALKSDAKGVGYDASLIAKMRVVEPLGSNRDKTSAPQISFHLVKMRESSGCVVDAYAA